MKITYYKENIKAFGKINFADYIINNAGIYSTICKHMRYRKLFTTYSYVDLYILICYLYRTKKKLMDIFQALPQLAFPGL